MKSVTVGHLTVPVFSTPRRLISLLAWSFLTTSLASPVALAQTTGVTNSWTGWLNRDRPSGNGDFETLSDLLREQPTKVCSTPSAIEARRLGSTEVFTPAAGSPQKFSAFSPDKGLVCLNADNKACLDYEIRLLCAPPTLGQLKLDAKTVEVMQLVEPRPEGNGIALVTLADPSKAPKEFSFDNDGVITLLNDTGKNGDAKAGDGVFSGFVRLNEKGLAATTEGFANQLAQVQKASAKPVVATAFNGRIALETTPFNSDQASLAESLAPTQVGDIAVRPLPIPFPIDLPPALVNPANALAINSPSVVANPAFTFDPCNTDGTGNNTNPNAPFSFKTLITNLNNETQVGRPSDQQFVHNWLRTWRTNQTVNGLNLPARPNIVQYFPGWDGVNASTLNLNNLPFRLLAVVNRIDLANVSAYGNSNPNKPGEIRFVFGLLRMQGASCQISSGIDQMTVIFEYRDATNSCSSLQSLAQQWINLDINVQNGTAPLGSPAYMNALKAITDTVTAPNANKLNQLRTNDFAFDGIGQFQPWQLREFVIGNPTPDLVPATIKQTPDFRQYRGFSAPLSNVLADYVAANSTPLLCDEHLVPDTFAGLPFLGSHTDYQSNEAWPVVFTSQTLPASFPFCYSPTYVPGTEVGIPPATLMQMELRHKLSLNACDDCHANETDTFFTHVNPVTRGLSGFMQGITVQDPFLPQLERQFNDLARRNQVLTGTANAFCGFGGPILLESFQAKQAALPMDH
jgi:hypothetical protein